MNQNPNQIFPTLNDKCKMNNLFQEIFVSWLNDNYELLTQDIVIEISTHLLHHKCFNSLSHEKILDICKKSSPKIAMNKICSFLLFPSSEIFYIFASILKQLNNQNLYENLIKLYKDFNENDLPKEEVNIPIVYYPVTSKPKGHILVINQTFRGNKTNKLERHGWQEENEKLQKVFEEKLNYKMNFLTDLTKEQMLSEIGKFVIDDCHRNCHAAGIILLSHGNKYCINDANEKPVLISRIIDLIKKGQVIEFPLFEKPIFIVINACRGGNSLKTLGGLFSLPSDVVEHLEEAEEDEDNLNETFELPKDCFLMFSTLPFHKSYRHEIRGSIFIEAMCEIIEKHGENKCWQEIIVLIAGKDGEYQLKNGFGLLSAVVPMSEVNVKKRFYLDTTFLNVG